MLWSALGWPTLPVWDLLFIRLVLVCYLVLVIWNLPSAGCRMPQSEFMGWPCLPVWDLLFIRLVLVCYLVLVIWNLPSAGCRMPQSELMGWPCLPVWDLLFICLVLVCYLVLVIWNLPVDRGSGVTGRYNRACPDSSGTIPSRT